MVISITLLVYNYNDDNKSSKVEKNLIGDLVLVKGGTYKMGCVEQQNDCNNDELPVHQVTLHDFYIGKTEVTVGQFKAFVDATNYQTEAEKDGGSYIWEASGWVKIPGADWRCDIMGQKRPSSDYHYPVIHISWNDAMAFVNWLNGVTKSRYYLPTEAEWEFAARGGLNSGGYIYAGSNNLGEVGWYGANSNFTVHPVSKKKPNELELHDMSGNVWEWCADWYGKYASSNQSNPQGPPKGNYRIFRGGSWLLGPMYCRVSARSNSTASFRNAYLGFRLAKRP
jgi:formylglycine-generating enzyme required for sulfatase activity